MRNFAKKALAFIGPISFAVICFGISVAVMDGFEDCSLFDRSDSLPKYRPSNCANDGTLLTRDVFWFLGIILILAPFAAEILFYWRRKPKENEIESIKIPNNN